jgi:hypothetical protein
MYNVSKTPVCSYVKYHIWNILFYEQKKILALKSHIVKLKANVQF